MSDSYTQFCGGFRPMTKQTQFHCDWIRHVQTGHVAGFYGLAFESFQSH